MANTLSSDYRGLHLRYIASSIDQVFEFSSDWFVTDIPGTGCWEQDGRIVIDLAEIDQLCALVQAGPADKGHVFRYVFAHLKAHHYQEIHPCYSKPYEEDVRPYELDADLVAGWICANARIPNSFRTKGIAPAFCDLGRRQLPQGQLKQLEYPWPEERELAFMRGARMWAAGQVSQYNAETLKQGMADESFHEFMAQVPAIVNGMWSRPVPTALLRNSSVQKANEFEHRVPVAGGTVGR